MNNVLQSAWIFPAFFLGLFGLGALLSVASGWRLLAGRFAAVTQPDSERYYFASAKMGRVPWFLVNYGACLVITVGATGISMSIFWPFRLFCPDFFLPWSEVESVEERTTPLTRRTLVRIRGSSVRVALRGTVGQRAAAMFARSKDATVP